MNNTDTMTEQDRERARRDSHLLYLHRINKSARAGLPTAFAVFGWIVLVLGAIVLALGSGAAADRGQIFPAFSGIVAGIAGILFLGFGAIVKELRLIRLRLTERA